MRIARRISIVTMAIVVMTMGLALPAHAGTEGAFVSKINASRAAAGLPALSTHSDLVPDARAHSAEMMAAGQIYHTTNLGGVASGWDALGENVGAGPSVDSLHAAFMNSSGHRANILGDFNYVGVGVAEQGGVIWVTAIFMRKGSAPEPTTTTTTTAPTTTTTAAEPAPIATPELEESPQPTTPAAQPSAATASAASSPAAAPPPPSDARSGGAQSSGTDEAAAPMRPFVQAPHRPFAD
jgi:hypothetical protein